MTSATASFESIMPPSVLLGAEGVGRCTFAAPGAFVLVGVSEPDVCDRQLDDLRFRFAGLLPAPSFKRYQELPTPGLRRAGVGRDRVALTHHREGPSRAQPSLWITLGRICAKRRGMCALRLWRSVEFR